MANIVGACTRSPRSSCPRPAPAPTLAELAERAGSAATFIIKSGDGARLAQRPRLAEAIMLKSVLLLLFEDPAEAMEKPRRRRRGFDSRIRAGA